jgi:cytochrome P450
MLLEARDTEGDGQGMSLEQVRDEAMTIFLAGHETTALAMAWTWYLLSQNPEAEATLHEELDRVLAGRPPTLEDVPKLAYTRQVLAESMRLFPPAWVLTRRAREATRFGEHDIPRGTAIVLSQWVVHRSPKLWQDPLRFDPGRWTPEAAQARHKFSYFPFGGGPRGCIGERFAWTEGVLVIATLAQRWKLRLAPGHVVAPEPMLTLRPKHGLRMVAEPRAR